MKDSGRKTCDDGRKTFVEEREKQSSPVFFIFSYLVNLNLEFQSVANPRPSWPLASSFPRRRVEEWHKNWLTVLWRLASRKKRQTKKLDERFKWWTAAEKFDVKLKNWKLRKFHFIPMPTRGQGSTQIALHPTAGLVSKLLSINCQHIPQNFKLSI